MPARLVPQIATSLRQYSARDFGADLIAGVIVGIVALPLAIAFGIASGVSPAQGVYTAIIAGFLISALGGSTVQIGGPTGAFVVIVFGIVAKYGYPGLAVATLMAGVILIVMGVVRLGGAIKFIPYPVTTGFTTGIALIIASQQVKDVFGLRMETLPAEFIERLEQYVSRAHTVNLHAVALSAAALAIIIWWPRVTRRVPSPFVALVACTALAHLVGLDVETIGSRFGDISFALPAPSLPRISFDDARNLVSPAISIALLAGIESLLSAVVADGMIGTRHRSNMELVAQGVANVASPLFGGIPATGAIARTATNIRNGARSPVAGIVHALTLLVIALALGRWAQLIPMCVLGAILLVVAYNMSEWRNFKSLLTTTKSDVSVLLITFGLTVIVDLTVAIEVGMILAAFLFMKRMADVTNVNVIKQEFFEDGTPAPANGRRRDIPRGVVVYEINGPFFFGAAETFKDTLATTMGKPKVLILRMRNVPAIDATGMHALQHLVRRTRHDGTVVLLSEIQAQPTIAMGRSGLLDELGPEQTYETFDGALDRARNAVTRAVTTPPS
jgi:SulP family sulfate permease